MGLTGFWHSNYQINQEYIMGKLAWAVIIGIVVLAILALGAGLLLPFWARGFGFGLARPGLLGGFGWQFLVFRGLGSFLFWVLVFLGIFLLIRSLAGRPSTADIGTVTVESPLEILKRRYAKGEINKEQYDEMRSTLGG
jgi:putative membrane protein